MIEPDYHTMPDGRRIAFRFIKGDGPTLVFLPGYMSDMSGSKANAIYEWARANRRACLLLDYSGCGLSEGNFADGSLTRWHDEVLTLIDAQLDGPILLIGSSMGGWLMLLVGESLGARLTGMIGIAAAPDFSDWGYDEIQKAELAAGRTVFEESLYGPDPTPTHALFWRDAERHRLLDRPIAIDCPVRLLHGQRDADVPWEISLRLAKAVRSDNVQVTLIKDGDHRLSREEDIALLLRQIDTLGN